MCVCVCIRRNEFALIKKFFHTCIRIQTCPHVPQHEVLDRLFLRAAGRRSCTPESPQIGAQAEHVTAAGHSLASGRGR